MYLKRERAHNTRIRLAKKKGEWGGGKGPRDIKGGREETRGEDDEEDVEFVLVKLGGRRSRYRGAFFYHEGRRELMFVRGFASNHRVWQKGYDPDMGHWRHRVMLRHVGCNFGGA